MAVQLVVPGAGVRRSPTHTSKHRRPSGGEGVGAGHHAPLRGQQRASWLRWLLPVVLASLLSSWLTWLVLHEARANGPGAGWHVQQQQPFHGVAGVPRRPRQLVGPDLDTRRTAAEAAAAAAAAAATAEGAARAWVAATGRRMRVALVNDAPYHLEIVAGMLQLLGGLPVDVTWYQAGQATPDGAYSPTELLEVTGFTQLLGYLPAMRPSGGGAPPPARADFAVLVSPEYYEAQTRAFLAAAQPVSAVVLAHNGMNVALKRIAALHPRLHFVALSPHVAAAARHALGLQTSWMLPTFPFKPKAPCSLAAHNASCLHGFSIQGNFESARRNYTRLWAQVQAATAAGALPTAPPAQPFQLHLVGRGVVASLGIPDAVAPYTTVHFNLRFPQYYDVLHHTHALLMLLGSANYLVQKMSSTVVSSLMTGVPVVADASVLAAYTFLTPDHVFLIAKGESEMDVMQRVLRMPAAEVYAVRQRVAELARSLGRQAREQMQTFMPTAQDVALAPPVA